MSNDHFNRHPTTRISWDGQEADIDAELAEAVLLLWQLGITTSGACQDEGESLSGPYFDRAHLSHYVERAKGSSYIQFPHLGEAVITCEILANGGPRDAFYERMVHWASPGAWSCRVSIEDLLLDGDDADWSLPSEFAPGTITLSFPRSDIPEVTRRLRTHLEDDATVVRAEPTWETVTLTEEEEAWHERRPRNEPGEQR